MTTSRTIDIPTSAGSGYTGYFAMPAAEKAGGIVLIQEIFGVNSHIRQVADLYADAGYFVLAPDVFWRVQPHVELGYTPEDIQEGIQLAGKLKPEQTMADMADAAKFLRQLPESNGKLAAVGYCFGGRTTYEMAANKLIDAAVSYYGGGIDQQLDKASNISCPIMMHFGEKDAHIPVSSVQKIQEALQGKPNVSIYVYKGADHGFNCDQRGSYDRQSAMLAFGRSMVMLNKFLG